MKVTRIKNAFSLTMELVQSHYKDAEKKYIEACKNLPEMRANFYIDIDQAGAIGNKTSTEAKTKRRKNIEAQQESGRALWRLKQAEKLKSSKVFMTIDGVRI